MLTFSQIKNKIFEAVEFEFQHFIIGRSFVYHWFSVNEKVALVRKNQKPIKIIFFL